LRFSIWETADLYQRGISGGLKKILPIKNNLQATITNIKITKNIRNPESPFNSPFNWRQFVFMVKIAIKGGQASNNATTLVGHILTRG
jgi:hypothetical protein